MYYYVKKREIDTINEIHPDLRHVTIAQHLGGGVHVWLMTAYKVALFYYCIAPFHSTFFTVKLDKKLKREFCKSVSHWLSTRTSDWNIPPNGRFYVRFCAKRTIFMVSSESLVRVSRTCEPPIGGGVIFGVVIAYNVALLYYCFAVFRR